MAWGAKGAKAGAADWCQKLKANDKTLSSLLVMRSRTMTSQDWVDFCAALADNKELRELKASSHALDTQATTAFSNMIAKNTALERLALGDSTLGDAGVTALCAGLASNTALQEIELDYKGITPLGATALAGMLKSNRGLRKLLLSRNPALGDAGVSTLCEGLRESQVKDLQLEEVEMGDEGARALATMFTHMKSTMTELSLCGNAALTGEGTAALLLGIASSPGVEHLNLDRCPRALSGGDAVRVLAEGLCSPTCPIQRLSLQDVTLPEESACKQQIARAVGASTRLREAKLMNMHLGDASLDALAQALSANPHSPLTILDLAGNDVTGDGLACLLLTENVFSGKLKSLRVFDNRVATHAHLPTLLQKAVEEGREVGRGLEDLDIGANKLERHFILELLSLLYASPSLLPSLRTLGLGANEGMQDADDELEAAVDALQERAIPLEVIYKAMGDDGKAGAKARADALAAGLSTGDVDGGGSGGEGGVGASDVLPTD